MTEKGSPDPTIASIRGQRLGAMRSSMPACACRARRAPTGAAESRRTLARAPGSAASRLGHERCWIEAVHVEAARSHALEPAALDRVHAVRAAQFEQGFARFTCRFGVHPAARSRALAREPVARRVERVD